MVRAAHGRKSPSFTLPFIPSHQGRGVLDTVFQKPKEHGPCHGRRKASMRVQSFSSSQRIIVNGKIATIKNLGYYLLGKDPPGEYMIVNLDEKKLKSLMKPKRVVTAEGYLTMGAEKSMIEKIDGKGYRSDGKANAQ